MNARHDTAMQSALDCGGKAKRDTALGRVLQTGTAGLCESAVAAALCRRSPKKSTLESKLV
jgi:hypothetical protein